MLLAGILFAILNASAKLLSADMSVAEVSFLRLFVQLVVFTPLILIRGGKLFGAARGFLAFRGVLGVSSMLLGFYATTKIPLSDVSALWKTNALFVALFSGVFLKEKISKISWLMILSGFVGVILVVKPKFDVANLGGIAALTAGLLLAAVTISIRKLHETEHSFSIIWSVSFWGCLFLAILFGHSFIIPERINLIALCLMGVSGVLGQLLYTEALKLGPAAWTQPFGYSEILMSFVVGVCVFQEATSISSAIGIIVLISSLIVLFRLRLAAVSTAK